MSGEFTDYLKENEILAQYTPPGTPQHNGVSERRNRTLLDMVRSMLSFTDLPYFLWGYALLTSAHLLNKIPSKAVPTTPYEIWTGRKPNLNYVKVWGCPAYVRMAQQNKLMPRGQKFRFVGYPSNTKGYLFYDTEHRNVFVARFGKFLESEFLSEGGDHRQVELDEVQLDTDEPLEEPEVQVDVEPSTHTLRRSNRESRPPERLYLI